jgi:formate hydrogenlyase subunit 6/NADH:ubiquinone oxidoreductase subunit I
MPARFRGHIELVLDPETGKALCFACKLCERACPSDCITVDGAKLEGQKKKSVTDYKLNFTKCSLCGSCVEACPFDAIEFSKDYNVVSLQPGRFSHMDLVNASKRRRRPGRRTGRPAARRRRRAGRLTARSGAATGSKPQEPKKFHEPLPCSPRTSSPRSSASSSPRPWPAR